MLLIAAQAVKLLDLPRFPPRPAKNIQSKLNGGRNGSMLKIGGIFPIQVTRLKRKSARRIRLQNTRYSERKGKRKSAGNHGKTLNVSLGEEPENDVIFTALVRMDENDSRIPVLFSLTSSCAASFAAFRGKVLEACGLSLKYVICIKISKSNCVKLLDGQYAYDSTDLSLILTTADDKVVELMLKGVSHKALAQLDKHSDEQSLQRIREPVTTACGQIDKMVRTDVPEL